LVTKGRRDPFLHERQVDLQRVQLMDKLSRRLIRLCRPLDRDRLIRRHLDTATDFAPSSKLLDPEVGASQTSWGGSDYPDLQQVIFA